MIHLTLQNKKGFTLIHLVMILIAFAIMAATAARFSTLTLNRNRKIRTEKEMHKILKGIYGEPEAVPQTNFGYIGDMGAMPTSINQLYSSQSGNWNGPYILHEFEEDPSDYLNDEWGQAYTLLIGSNTGSILSLGSGDSVKVDFFVSPNKLMQNVIEGNVRDWYNDKPNLIDRLAFFRMKLYRKGNKYNLNQQVGSTLTVVNSYGKFYFSGIPCGNYEVECDYLRDSVGAMRVSVTVLPMGGTYSITFKFNTSFPD